MRWMIGKPDPVAHRLQRHPNRVAADAVLYVEDLDLYTSVYIQKTYNRTQRMGLNISTAVRQKVASCHGQVPLAHELTAEQI